MILQIDYLTRYHPKWNPKVIMKGNTKQFPKWFTRYYYLGSPEGVPKVVIKDTIQEEDP